MKKIRGLRRYYKNLFIQNDFDNIEWLDINDITTWKTNWHLHFDNKSLGNISFTKRKPHLDKLFRHLSFLVDKTKSLKSDFQLYAIILDYNSSSDAIFLHEPNVKGNAFPFKLSDMNINSNLTNKLLDDYIKNKNLTDYIILFGKAEENFCFIYNENRGKSFE